MCEDLLMKEIQTSMCILEWLQVNVRRINKPNRYNRTQEKMILFDSIDCISHF